MADLVIQEFYDEHKSWHAGDYVYALPPDQQTALNYTSEIGGGVGLYLAIVFQFPKWRYKLKKIDEWMDVSPTHAQSYEVTMGQKQKLEGQIKQGLASAAQSVADFELAKHDLRKYKEIINYFLSAEKDKDEHVIRSLFIDRVDAYTGDNFSMIGMTKRWPTIITDFIRMGTVDKKDRKDIDKIKDKLQVTQAEATVLKTKNELFESWKTMFFPEVQERYARIKTLVKAREKSIYEYREWLKPYVSRFKMMADSLQKKPQNNLSNVYMAPGFGNAFASSGIRFLAWMPFTPPEMSKPERIAFDKSGAGIDPLDDVVMEWGKRIAEKHKVWGKEVTNENGNIEYKIDEEKLREKLEEIRDNAYNGGEQSDMKKNMLYYRCFDINVVKHLGKIPGKGELEDITFDIKHRTFSQNVLLIHVIELHALEEKFSKNIEELIGSKESEERDLEEVRGWFKEEKKEEKKKKFSVGKIKEPFKRLGKKLLAIFFRPGPYESNFDERISKMYLLPAGMLYGEIIAFIKWKMGIPGAGPVY